MKLNLTGTAQKAHMLRPPGQPDHIPQFLVKLKDNGRYTTS